MKNQLLRIDRDQAEKLAELGHCLQEFRQQKGLSLEEIAARTLIPVRTLAALETADRKHLPEPVYIQGFIRRYADAIGLNGAELAIAFPTCPIVAPPRPTWNAGFAFQAQLRPLHLYLLYMVLVMGAVSGLSYLLNRSGQPTMLSSLAPAAVPPRLTPTSQIGPVAPTPTQTIPSPASPLAQKSLRVGVTLTSQSWIRVVADGKMEFEGVLPEGTKRQWVADKQVTVRAGNAGGVLVSLNDGQAKQLGQPGSVEEVTFGGNVQAASWSSPLDNTQAHHTSLTASSQTSRF